jgi:NADPH-dependent 2,4-dienoyl-CoA reductase/sulfur reductase-like enzyme
MRRDMHRVAIVGAGPAGFYAADGLLRANPDLRIDLIDRLPTPFGLVRAGVAPDHQGTKAVARQFDRLLSQPTVRFCGNVEIGRDLSWDELREHYDAVIVATGRTIDRKPAIPGEERALGSWRFVAWLNGHPDFAGKGPDLSKVKRVAVIGNGNVALDVARVLAKSADEMAKSDIVPEAGAAIAAAPITDIDIVGRRGPEQASFTNNELAEFGRLARAVPLVDAKALDIAPPAGDPTPEKLRKNKNLEILRGFAKNKPGSKPVAIHFLFSKSLAAIPGDYDLVITAIGYDGEPLPEGDGIFAVGWARRGPTGTIPTNRADSHAVAKEVADWLADRTPKSGTDPMPPCVDAAGWHRIDKAELAAGAKSGRPRTKVTDWQGLLDIAQGD